MSVLVYLVNPDDRVKDSARLFRSNLFRFNTINISDVNHFSDYDHLTATYLDILQRSRREMPAGHVIILHKHMTTSIHPDQMAALISNLVADREADVYYLSKYLDRCDLYDQTQRLRINNIDTGFLTSVTKQPNGIQALMFSPQGREQLLSSAVKDSNSNFNSFLRQLVEHGQLFAKTVTPNMFTFDLTRAENADDLMFLNECIPPPSSTSSNSMSIIVFIVVIVIVLVIAFVALWLGGVRLNGHSEMKSMAGVKTT